MPIKGMTDKTAAFPIIGVLRKGAKKSSANKPGADLTYFRFVSEDTAANAAFLEAYPDEASMRRINVFLPNATTEENFDAWIEKWVAGGLIYRSDGEKMVLWRTDKGSYSTEEKPDPNPGEGEDGKRTDGSGYVGRLSVIIPELGRFATVTMLTTSKHDIINLNRALKAFESMRGDLRGIPFILVRKKRKISTPGNGKRVRREKWLLEIEPAPDWSRLKLVEDERSALPDSSDLVIDQPTELAQLPSIIQPFEDELETDDEQLTEDEPIQEFSTIDDLLYKLCVEFGISEQQAKDALKECGFTTFSQSKSVEMYVAAKKHLGDEQDKIPF